MKRLLWLAVLLPALAAAQAALVTRDGVTLSPRQEQRAEAIGLQLRCLVCQNESIEGSSAPLAKQLRVIIRHQVVAGAPTPSILDYMVRRYGIFVLLRPPLSPLTALLYAMPVLALALGLAAAWGGRRMKITAPAALDAAEEARLRALLEPEATRR